MRFLALLLLLPLSALAGIATLTCTPPTTFTDGSAITGAITYNFYRGLSSAAVTTKLNATPVTSCAYVDASAPVGTDWWAATAIVGGIESAPSAAVSKTVSPSTPAAPTGLTVTGPGIAYKVRQAVDGFSLVRIGTIPLGTACNASHSIDGYSLVPRDSVIMDSKIDTKPLIALSQCS